MKREVTTQEALTELAAAKMKLESMQQLLVLKEHLLSSKDDQINFQIFTIKEKDETFKLVKAAGYPAVIIFGEPDYYPKVGFKRIGSYNITDADGNTWDAMMIYPMDNEALKNIKGIFTESPDFEKCDNEAAVREIEKEFPLYPKIKIQDGFLQIYGGRFGIIKAVEKDCYKVSFWELEIPAVLSKEVDKIPKAGDVVIFNWNNNGVSEITRICQNLI